MIVSNKNYARQQPKFSDGDVIIGCNLSQEAPGTSICMGVKNLKFVSCNLMNCMVPVDSKVEDCLTIQKVIEPEPGISLSDAIIVEVTNLINQYGKRAIEDEIKEYFNL